MSLELNLENISFRYTGLAASDREVLSKISLTFSRCECTAIVGPSGSGKTTLIQHFTGLLNPTAGRVLVDGKDLAAKKFPLANVRQRIGLVFQFPEAQLFEETVARDIAYGPTQMGLEADMIEQRVKQAMELVKLNPAEFAERSPFHLSEGEKRRAAIAGVLAMQPEMVVLDEPTAGLDPSGVTGVVDLIESLIEQGTAVVVVTHHMDLVADVANRVIVMQTGSVLFDGSPRQLFHRPELLQKAELELPEFLTALHAMGDSAPAAWKQAISFRQLQHLLGS